MQKVKCEINKKPPTLAEIENVAKNAVQTAANGIDTVVSYLENGIKTVGEKVSGFFRKISF